MLINTTFAWVLTKDYGTLRQPISLSSMWPWLWQWHSTSHGNANGGQITRTSSHINMKLHQVLSRYYCESFQKCTSTSSISIFRQGLAKCLSSKCRGSLRNIVSDTPLIPIKLAYPPIVTLSDRLQNSEWEVKAGELAQAISRIVALPVVQIDHWTICVSDSDMQYQQMCRSAANA